MPDLLTNSDLRAEWLPQSGDHEALARFAHKIDGYTVAGGGAECVRLAHDVSQYYKEFKTFCHSLTDLRISLFCWHRAWRSDIGSPTDDDYAYAEALVGAIRGHLERREHEPRMREQHPSGLANLQFLFGRPVAPARPIADGPRATFVLGAYPSALHVAWDDPDGTCLVRAVAVDNEPEPFWNGRNEAELLRAWRAEVPFQHRWGQVRECGRLNGSSGKWLDERVLCPLGANRESTWITDCLDVYHQSAAAATRMADVEMERTLRELGIAAPHHLAHPTEDQIVSRSLKHERERLLNELATSRPGTVVTLGNAALRVFGGLATEVSETKVQLAADDSYGRAVRCLIAGLEVRWIPLAHPAAPARYQALHLEWVRRMSGRGPDDSCR